jgi:hypothetical protein
MPRVGTYDHLEETDPLQIALSMKDMVALIRKQNYGEHRLLSELVRQREESEDEQKYEEHRRHTAMLRALLESGYY